MTPQTQHAGPALPGRHTHHHRAHVVPALAGRLAIVAALVCAFTLLTTASAFAITRDQVLDRAQTWIDNPVPYSQSAYFGGYRTDCSGYASMCWQTGTSWNTRTFYRVTSTITTEQLKPGDALLKVDYHIRIFYGWVDPEHTMYVAYEQTGPVTKSSIKSIASDLAVGYKPTRYNGIVDSPPPPDALVNGTFDTWASGKPVWWSVTGASKEDTPVVQRNDMPKAGRFSLELHNPYASATRFVTLEQTAAVDPGTPYALSAWARSAGATAPLEIRLRYLDAGGATLVDTRTTGAACGVNDAEFREMRLPVPSPPGAATAVVTARLGGAPAADASSTAGSSVVLDELALELPHSEIDIHTNATSTRIGRVPILSGKVAPAGLVGTNIVVYVKRPGKTYWSYSSNRTVYDRYGVPSWQYKYYFKPGMVRGTYHYKAHVPPRDGLLPATSGIVSIRVL